MRRGLIAILILAAALGVGIAEGVYSLRSSSAARPSNSAARSHPGTLRGQATWAAGARPAPAITGLRDQSGRAFSLASLRSRPVAMTFFDSHCHQACPLEGRALASAEQAVPAGERPILVVVSVNPLDTPASTRTAMRKWGLAGLTSWYWLRGSHAALARAWKAYHIFVAPLHGDISHTEALYLIDRRGDERSAYLYPFTTRFVSGDLRALAGDD
jgi:protein SCO1/2